MSAGDINFVTGLWAASLAPHNDSPPFKNAKDMYDTIDSTPLGDIPWQSFTLNYNGSPLENLGPDGESPSWTTDDYDIWFHNPHLLVQELIANPEFNGQFDFTPFQEYSTDGQHRFENFMSGDWAWKQAVSGSLVDQFQCLLWVHRIRLSSTILRIKVHFLYPSFLEVTRPQFPSLLARLTTGRCTFLSAIYTTMCGAHIKMASCF